MPRVQNPQPEPIRQPDWGDFKLAMLGNGAYQKLSESTSSKLAVTRLETLFATQVDNWAVAQQLWQLMIGGCPEQSRPTAFEVAQWNAIAAGTQMPITFDDKGLFVPDEQEEDDGQIT
ncbi:MAG: hypothetical protein AAFV46_00890 [Cyanobacteria bacterium J06635_11]